jgi:secreted trypsin-like serine protease
VGKHNLDREGERGSAAYQVIRLTLHEDWKHETDDFDADIALLTLDTKVDLTNRQTVRIVCLPQSSTSEVTGMGTVVGWGISERSLADREQHDSKPNKLELPAVTKQQCFASNDSTADQLDLASSERTFCAGFVNQNKSACKGDSGGGFYVYDRSKKTYNVAGIVSSSLPEESGGCRTDTYSIFTDVSKFIDWIHAKMVEAIEYETARTKQGRLFHLDHERDSHYFELLIEDEDLVPNSVHVEVSVVGDVLGTSLVNVENLM